MRVKARIFVRPDGSLLAVYQDGLRALGLPITSVRRVSTVDFNKATGSWESRLLSTMEKLAESTARDTCIAQEHAEVEKRIVQDIKHYDQTD